MESERQVEMIRLERPEQLYDREEIFGRDATSVFPKSAAQSAEGSGPDMIAIKDSLGASKFITESELEMIKSRRGGSVEDGSINADKSLSEVLRENRDKKNDAFQEQWKQMKTGKNRPLDADELQFYDNLIDEEQQRDAAWSNLQRAEMEEFRAALQASTKPDGLDVDLATKNQTSQQPSKRAPANKAPVVAKPIFKPVLKVKPKNGVVAGGVKRTAESQEAAKDAKVTKTDGKTDKGGDGDGDEGSDEEGGLAGLLGGYGSASDS